MHRVFKPKQCNFDARFLIYGLDHKLSSCKHYYYALNKMQSSDWLTTNLTLDDVRLVGSNLTVVANSERISDSTRNQCQVSSNQCHPDSNALSGQ